MNLSVNYGKSFAYYIQAAQKGDMAGQANVAEFYMEGKGIEKMKKRLLNGIEKQQSKGMLILNMLLDSIMNTMEMI